MQTSRDRPPGGAPGTGPDSFCEDAADQAFLVSQKISAISSIFASSLSATAASQLALGARGAGELGGLVHQRVQLRVLLEVRGLEVVGPQHPEVVLDELRALLLDQDGARAEVGVVVVRDLADDGLDRLGLDAGLGGVVHATGQVAVGGNLDGGGEQSREHPVSSRLGSLFMGRSPATLPRVSGTARGAHGPHESTRRSALPLGLARVRGESMLPTLRPGDLLLVRYAAPRATRLPRPRPLRRRHAGREACGGAAYVHDRGPRLVAAERQPGPGGRLAAPRRDRRGGRPRRGAGADLAAAGAAAAGRAATDDTQASG